MTWRGQFGTELQLVLLKELCMRESVVTSNKVTPLLGATGPSVKVDAKVQSEAYVRGSGNGTASEFPLPSYAASLCSTAETCRGAAMPIQTEIWKRISMQVSVIYLLSGIAVTYAKSADLVHKAMNNKNHYPAENNDIFNLARYTYYMHIRCSQRWARGHPPPPYTPWQEEMRYRQPLARTFRLWHPHEKFKGFLQGS